MNVQVRYSSIFKCMQQVSKQKPVALDADGNSLKIAVMVRKIFTIHLDYNIYLLALVLSFPFEGSFPFEDYKLFVGDDYHPPGLLYCI